MSNGYVRIFEPAHPLANKDGQVLEHRKVLHDAGVEVPKGAHVHHLNGDKQDNRVENLVLKTVRDHHRDHARERGYVDNQYGRWQAKAERRCAACGASFRPWKPDGKFCSRGCANRRTARSA